MIQLERMAATRSSTKKLNPASANFNRSSSIASSDSGVCSVSSSGSFSIDDGDELVDCSCKTPAATSQDVQWLSRPDGSSFGWKLNLKEEQQVEYCSCVSVKYCDCEPRTLDISGANEQQVLNLLREAEFDLKEKSKRKMGRRKSDGLVGEFENVLRRLDALSCDRKEMICGMRGLRSGLGDLDRRLEKTGSELRDLGVMEDVVRLLKQEEEEEEQEPKIVLRTRRRSSVFIRTVQPKIGRAGKCPANLIV